MSSSQLAETIHLLREAVVYYEEFRHIFPDELHVVTEVLNLVEQGAIDRSTRDRANDIVTRSPCCEFNGSMWPYFLAVFKAWREEAERLDPEA